MKKEIKQRLHYIAKCDPDVKQLSEKFFEVPCFGIKKLEDFPFDTDWNLLMQSIQRIAEKFEPNWTLHAFIDETICCDDSYDTCEDLCGLYVYYLEEIYNEKPEMFE